MTTLYFLPVALGGNAFIGYASVSANQFLQIVRKFQRYPMRDHLGIEVYHHFTGSPFAYKAYFLNFFELKANFTYYYYD